MDYGVTITRGAAPWQIFQQGPDGTAALVSCAAFSVF